MRQSFLPGLTIAGLSSIQLFNVFRLFNLARLRHCLVCKYEQDGADTVKWLEIIKLRSAESGDRLLEEFLRPLAEIGN
jgi:hypothetical protein